MTHTVDTLMALAYKIRDARTYEWDVSEAVEAGKALRAALTEALAQPNHSEQHLDMVAAQAAQPVRDPLTSQVLHDLSPIFGGDK
jgi:hypothetical protein